MASIRIRAIVLVFAAVGSVAFAKLPAPSDEAKAKAAEAAAKTAWSDKVAGYQLCKAQDRVATNFFANMKTEGREVKPALETPPCADPGPFVSPPAAAVAAPATAAPPSAAAASSAMAAAKKS